MCGCGKTFWGGCNDCSNGCGCGTTLFGECADCNPVSPTANVYVREPVSLTFTSTSEPQVIIADNIKLIKVKNNKIELIKYKFKQIDSFIYSMNDFNLRNFLNRQNFISSVDTYNYISGTKIN